MPRDTPPEPPRLTRDRCPLLSSLLRARPGARLRPCAHRHCRDRVPLRRSRAGCSAVTAPWPHRAHVRSSRNPGSYGPTARIVVSRDTPHRCCGSVGSPSRGQRIGSFPPGRRPTLSDVVSPQPSTPLPLVSLVMPVLNEAEHLSTALDAIDRQTYPADRLELLIVDGGSTDHTLEFVQQRMKDDSRIRLLGGRGVNTPMAMNLGIEASTGDFIAKIDGHGWSDERFVDTAVTTMLVDETVGCVGGSIVPVAETTAERANAIARFSLLGVGSGIYTAPKRLHETETVQCGVYRRRAIIDAGGFDPSLPYGEDEEANYRVRQAGWKVLFNPGMPFHYRVRPSASALFRQYYRYGHARVAVV